MNSKGRTVFEKKLPIKYILILVIFLSANAQAKNYYVSSNGNNSNDGLTIATAWQTIAKVNSFTFGWGDFILFKRGDTFYGSIVVSRSNLNYGAYGTGAKPIISGLSTVTGWVNLGGNIWEAPNVGVKGANNLVLRNSSIQQIGRYPNADAANGGYLTYTASTTTSITGPELSTKTNWAGAEVAIRLNRWEILRKKVTTHAAGVVSFVAHASAPRLNYGYFFQRDPKTLDQDGEWWQDGTNNKLRMYFSNNNPSAYTVQASTIEVLISNITGYYNNVVISDLSFIGSGKTAIYILAGANHKVLNCDIINSGAAAISIWSANNVIVDNCTTKNSLGSGIQISNNNNNILSSITNCVVDSTALIAGMETSNESNGGDGILNRGGNNVYVTHCKVLNSGYVGIGWYGNDAFIKYNLVDTYCKVRDDGAGIYTAENSDTAKYQIRYNRNVVGNIVLNGIGQGKGTSTPNNINSVTGIYVDDGAAEVLIDSNTVAYIPKSAVHGNNNRRISVTNNTTFNTGFSFSSQRLKDGKTVIGMRVTKNIFYPYRFNYGNVARDRPEITTVASIQNMGIIDSNYYSLRAGTDTSLKTVTTLYNGTGYIEQNLPFSYLTDTVGFEKKSINVPNTGRLEYNASNTPIIVQFSGLSKKDVFGNVYNNSVTIPAWRSMVLIPNGTTTPNKAPIANAGVDKTIILPTNSSTLTGTATDSDGTILSYAWVKISGPLTGTIVSPASANTNLNSLGQGIYRFELTVVDNNGTTGRDTVQITVNLAGNQIPIANAGTDKAISLPTNNSTLTGTGNDTDGTIASYAWAKIAGPSSGTIASPAAAGTTINNLVQGIYQFELRVTDNGGANGRDTVQVTVSATGNQIPKVNAGADKVITLPTNSTTLTGTGTDSDGTIASYAWAKIAGPSSGTIASPAAAGTTINNLVQGIYQFELRVTDNGGAIGRDTVQVMVNPQPASIKLTSAAIETINCSGNSSTIDVTANGGTAPYIGTGSFNTDAGKGTLKISFPNSSSTTQTTIYFKVLNIVAGKNYVLRFTTLGSMDNVQMDVTLKKFVSPFTRLATAKTTSFGTSIKQHELIFTPTISDVDSRIDIWLTQNSGITYLDNIAFFEADSSGQFIGNNQVPKGQFETDMNAIRFWSSNGNQLIERDSTGKIGNINYYTVTDALGKISSVGLPIKQSATVLAAAVSLQGSHILTVSATGGTSPYTGTGTFTGKIGVNTFIVTDAIGCTNTVGFTISPLTAIAIESPVNCSGNTSSVTVTSIGGAGPYTGTGIFNTNAGKGTLKISFPSASTTQTTIYFSVGSIVAGKSYALRFSTLGSMDNVKMDITLKKYVSPFTLLSTSKTTNFGTAIKQHEFIFTPTISDADSRIDLWLTQNSGITHLDNLSFFEVDTAGLLVSNNLVPKGQFETDIRAVRFWSSNSNQLVQWDNSSKIGNINYYSVTDADGSISTVGLPIKQSTTILTAAVSQSSNNLIVAATGGTSPYTGSDTFIAKLGLNTFTVTDANGCTATTSINVTSLSAARVSVRTTQTAAAPLNIENPSQTFKINCFPNPAINDFTLIVEEKSNKIINVLVLSEDGKVVFQTTGIANKRYKFGEDFATGLYIIKVTNGNDSKTLKIIKSSR